MRIAFAGDDLWERTALRTNQAPFPAAYALYPMPAARALQVAQRLGLLPRLAREGASAAALAAEFSLQEAGVRLLLDCLVAVEILGLRAERYELTPRARPWLDPRSPRSIATWIDHTYDYWEWFGDLESIVRDGGSIGIHADETDPVSWARYIRGQFELARLSATEVARAIELPREPRSLLDVAGAHGWFAAEICRRHERLASTVVDLPASARVGREIIAEAGMSDRVSHRDGDMFTADLGGPHDGVLCFDILHHLDPPQIDALLGRLHAAMAPGATLAVLDMFRTEGGTPRASAAYLGLFFHITSGANLLSPAELADHLQRAGFRRPRRARVRRIPDQELYLTSRA
ncbi:MAG: hypothetical protein NVSMB51_13640 [Solirubrobacteraceae bacterium]